MWSIRSLKSLGDEMMTVTIELTDYSQPIKPPIRIHSTWKDGNKIELEVKGERYTLSADELISAIKRAKLNVFGE